MRRHQGGSRSGDQPSRQCDGRPARPPPRASCLDSGVRRDDAESEERDVRRYGNPGRDRRGGRGSTLRVTDQARAPHPTCSGLRGRRSGGRSDRTRWRAQLGRIKLRSLSYTESGTASKRLSRVGVGAPSFPAVRGLPPPRSTGPNQTVGQEPSHLPWSPPALEKITNPLTGLFQGLQLSVRCPRSPVDLGPAAHVQVSALARSPPNPPCRRVKER